MPGPYTPRAAASIWACPPPPCAASSRPPSSPASAWRSSAGPACSCPSLIRQIEPAFGQDRRRRRCLLLRQCPRVRRRVRSVAGCSPSASAGGSCSRSPSCSCRSASRHMAIVPSWTLFLVAADPLRHRPGRHRRRDERARPRPLPGRSGPGAQPPPPVLQSRRAGLAAVRRTGRRCRRDMAGGHPRERASRPSRWRSCSQRCVCRPVVTNTHPARARSGPAWPCRSSCWRSRSPATSAPRSASATGSCSTSRRRR